MEILKMSSACNTCRTNTAHLFDFASFTSTVVDVVTRTTEMLAWLRHTAGNRGLNCIKQSAYYIEHPVAEHY
jgi:hypothetical protein